MARREIGAADGRAAGPQDVRERDPAAGEAVEQDEVEVMEDEDGAQPRTRRLDPEPEPASTLLAEEIRRSRDGDLPRDRAGLDEARDVEEPLEVEAQEAPCCDGSALGQPEQPHVIPARASVYLPRAGGSDGGLEHLGVIAVDTGARQERCNAELEYRESHRKDEEGNRDRKREEEREGPRRPGAGKRGRTRQRHRDEDRREVLNPREDRVVTA
jgi:hypothetical protein